MRTLRVLALPFVLSAVLVAGGQGTAPTAFAAGGHSSAATTAAKKKGISAWKFHGVTKALADSDAGWFYTWSSGKDGIKPPRGVEFVPMIHDAGSVTEEELGRAKRQGSTLLGFNEPDRPDQAHMTVTQHSTCGPGCSRPVCGSALRPWRPAAMSPAAGWTGS